MPWSHRAGAALPPFLHANLRLAQEAARRAHEELDLPAPPTSGQISVDVRGRFEQHELDGVTTLVDAAHNPQAFRALLAAAAARAGGRPLVALVALGADRDPAALAEALRDAPSVHTIVATAFRSRPARGAGDVAAAISGPACRSRSRPTPPSPGATPCSGPAASAACSSRSAPPTSSESCPRCARGPPNPPTWYQARVRTCAGRLQAFVKAR